MRPPACFRCGRDALCYQRKNSTISRTHLFFKCSACEAKHVLIKEPGEDVHYLAKRDPALRNKPRELLEGDDP